MRGAFGKPQGTVARVHIGQVIMSIRTKVQNKEHVIEALRRAKFKFPGRQKVKCCWGTTFNVIVLIYLSAKSPEIIILIRPYDLLN